ncbi:hypothetical protein AC578_1327 [Pseudocercospora eumusae]|uniref:SnoaL-like domain-containing protein n=1 Tax=Pseudocercospora eumusae TaxID=321146 RepID=A0A139HUN3_9PEZI|nr:hypothetical protein AC578_1327 [Pseudocercospora eumusae]
MNCPTCHAAACVIETSKRELDPVTSSNLEAHLHELITSSAEAITTRNLDPDCYPWDHFAENFCFPMDSIPWTTPRTKHSFLDGLRHLTQEFPEHKVCVTEIMTLDVHKTHKTIEIYGKTSVTGIPNIPKGMDKTFLNVFLWKYCETDRIWKIRTISALPGIDPR